MALFIFPEEKISIRVMRRPSDLLLREFLY